MPEVRSTNAGVLASSVLPAWSAAVPFWLGSDWLWLAPGRDGAQFWCGSGDHISGSGQVTTPQQLPAITTFQVIVLDGRAVSKPDSTWWPLLSAALSSGGLLLVCPAAGDISAELGRAAPQLAPAGPHIFELRQDDTWWLRPDSRHMLRFVSKLVPPYSRRAWLGWLGRNIGLHGRRVCCQPVWKTDVGR